MAAAREAEAAAAVLKWRRPAASSWAVALSSRQDGLLRSLRCRGIKAWRCRSVKASRCAVDPSGLQAGLLPY
jgi:hypothetical protein